MQEVHAADYLRRYQPKSSAGYYGQLNQQSSASQAHQAEPGNEM